MSNLGKGKQASSQPIYFLHELYLSLSQHRVNNFYFCVASSLQVDGETIILRRFHSQATSATDIDNISTGSKPCTMCTSHAMMSVVWTFKGNSAIHLFLWFDFKYLKQHNARTMHYIALFHTLRIIVSR